jgi:hypothetical protein
MIDREKFYRKWRREVGQTDHFSGLLKNQIQNITLLAGWFTSKGATFKGEAYRGETFKDVALF